MKLYVVEVIIPGRVTRESYAILARSHDEARTLVAAQQLLNIAAVGDAYLIHA